MSARANSGVGRWCYSLVESSMKCCLLVACVLSTAVRPLRGVGGVERGCGWLVGGVDTLLGFETSRFLVAPCGGCCGGVWLFLVPPLLVVVPDGVVAGVGGCVVCVLNSGREHLKRCMCGGAPHAGPVAVCLLC